MPTSTSTSSEEIKANMRSIIARDGDSGLLAARARVLEVHADPDTREQLRDELGRWLQCAQEVLGDLSQRTGMPSRELNSEDEE